LAAAHGLSLLSLHAALPISVLDLAWLQRLVLGLGEAVLEVHPPQVAEHISAAAHRALAAYDAGPPPGTGTGTGTGTGSPPGTGTGTGTGSPPTTGTGTVPPPGAPAGPDGGR